MSKSHLYGCIDVDGRKGNEIVSETNRTEPEYLLWGRSKRGNYYVTCVDNKRGVTYDIGCFFGRIVLREV